MNYILQFITCTAIFYGTFHFLLRDKNQFFFNRFYLLVSIPLAIIIPLLQIPIFPEFISIQPSLIPSITTTSITESSNSLSWNQIAISIYILGVAVHIGLIIYSLFNIHKIIKEGKKIHADGFTKIITTSDIKVSSFLSYLFIPKDRARDITEYELIHELTHINQKHTLDILFVSIIHALFWFNPILILFKRRLIEIHEFLADNESIKISGKPNYEIFLAKNTNAPQLQLVHNFYSLFEKRIHMMNSEKKIKVWQFAIILPLFIATLMAFSFEKYPVYQMQNESGFSATQIDTFPPIPADLVGKEIDTIFTFDPETMKETITYQLSALMDDSKNLNVQANSIDTIIIFDPDAKSEMMIIIDNSTGKRDTIR